MSVVSLRTIVTVSPLMIDLPDVAKYNSMDTTACVIEADRVLSDDSSSLVRQFGSTWVTPLAQRKDFHVERVVGMSQS